MDIEATMASNLFSSRAGMMPSHACSTHSHFTFASAQTASAISISKPESLPLASMLMKGG